MYYRTVASQSTTFRQVNPELEEESLQRLQIMSAVRKRLDFQLPKPPCFAEGLVFCVSALCVRVSILSRETLHFRCQLILAALSIATCVLEGLPYLLLLLLAKKVNPSQPQSSHKEPLVGQKSVGGASLPGD